MRLPICGGNWNNAANAGVFNVNLNNVRSNSNDNIGFRSALPSVSQICWQIKVCFPVQEGIKESISTPGSIAGEKQPSIREQ